MKKIILLMFLSLMCFTCCKTSQKAASKNLPLCGTQWNLLAIEQEAITEDNTTQPYIIFDTEGNFHGNLSCNDFMGTYWTRKQQMHMEYTGATKKLCPKMEVEKNFLKALKMDITDYTIDGSILVISNGSKEIMRFQGTTPEE